MTFDHVTDADLVRHYRRLKANSSAETVEDECRRMSRLNDMGAEIDRRGLVGGV